MRIKHLAGAAAALAMAAAHPAVAASDRQDLAASQRTPSAFAGLSLRLPLGGRAAEKPFVALQLTTTYDIRDARTGSRETVRPRGLEIGPRQDGRPALFLNGQDTAAMRHGLNLSGGTSTLLIVGGVLVVVVLAAAAAGSGLGDTCPEYEGSRDHCINP